MGWAGPSHSYARIYDVVRRIPRGRVATYGQVAALAGFPGRARLVGYALHALQEPTDVPWHRVINAQGRISARADPMFVDIQRRLLESEGIAFRNGDRITLNVYQWHPRRHDDT